MTILKFRVYWEEDDTVYRDIAVKPSQTFLDLFKAILTSYSFDDKHKATIYRSNDMWKRGREISLEKYDKDYIVDPLIMAETTIGSEITDPNQKFILVYDFNKNWMVSSSPMSRRISRAASPRCVTPAAETRRSAAKTGS